MMSDAPLPDAPRAHSSRAVSLGDFVLALRPTQWPKNLIVLAAFLFAFWDRYHTHVLGRCDFCFVLLAMVVFCILSSGMYLINDIADIESDRHHPVKRNRPIAAGRMPVRLAAATAILLLAGGLLAARSLHTNFFLVTVAYVAIQLGYTFLLKRLVFIDVLVIAIGFVLRAVAGALVIEVDISPWLLLCTFLLALFLGLCKRRHEKTLAPETNGSCRPALEHYDQQLLDQLIAIVSAATIVSYAMYTLSPETVRKFDTTALGFTIPFAVFGIFRYLDLVYRHKRGGRPERILLTDLPTLLNVLLYGISVVVIFLITQHRL